MTVMIMLNKMRMILSPDTDDAVGDDGLDEDDDLSHPDDDRFARRQLACRSFPPSPRRPCEPGRQAVHRMWDGRHTQTLGAEGSGTGPA